MIVAGEADIDRVAEAFARVIDAKSPWTYQHSSGVAATAVAIGERLGYGRVALRELRRVGAAPRSGQAGSVEPDPGQARQADRPGIRGHAQAPAVHARDPDPRAVLPAIRPVRLVTPRASGRQGISPRRVRIGAVDQLARLVRRRHFRRAAQLAAVSRRPAGRARARHHGPRGRHGAGPGVLRCAQSRGGRPGDRGAAGGAGGAPRVIARRGLLPGRLTGRGALRAGLRFAPPGLDEMVHRAELRMAPVSQPLTTSNRTTGGRICFQILGGMHRDAYQDHAGIVGGPVPGVTLLGEPDPPIGRVQFTNLVAVPRDLGGTRDRNPFAVPVAIIGQVDVRVPGQVGQFGTLLQRHEPQVGTLSGLLIRHRPRSQMAVTLTCRHHRGVELLDQRVKLGQLVLHDFLRPHTGLRAIRLRSATLVSFDATVERRAHGRLIGLGSRRVHVLIGLVVPGSRKIRIDVDGISFWPRRRVRWGWLHWIVLHR